MQPKYLVEVTNENGEITTQTYTTRQAIVLHYQIPLYIVDKIIKLTNDATFVPKRNSHRIYNDLVKSTTIRLIKPKVVY